MRYFKIMNLEEISGDDSLGRILIYKDGLNEDIYMDINKKEEGEHCWGIYFTDIKHIFAYLNYGVYVREVIVPENAIFEERGERMSINSEYIPGYHADKVYLNPRMELSDISTIMFLVHIGADISVEDYFILKWAKRNNYNDIYHYIKLLKEMKEKDGN